MTAEGLNFNVPVSDCVQEDLWSVMAETSSAAAAAVTVAVAEPEHVTVNVVTSGL